MNTANGINEKAPDQVSGAFSFKGGEEKCVCCVLLFFRCHDFEVSYHGKTRAICDRFLIGFFVN